MAADNISLLNHYLNAAVTCQVLPEGNATTTTTTTNITGTDNIKCVANETSEIFYPSRDITIRVLARFHLLAPPIIVLMGLVSNGLSFLIFVSSSLRRTSCSIYLAARSLSDSGFLLSVFVSWLGDLVGVAVVHTVGVCQLWVFSSYVFAFLSVWLVVCITLENYIRICHPFSVSRFCTARRAGQVLQGLVGVSLAIYHIPLWTTQVAMEQGRQRCSNKPQYMAVAQGLMYGDLIATLLLPSLLIIFFMAAISLSLVSSLKRQSRLKGVTLVPPASNDQGGPSNGRCADGQRAIKGTRKSKSPQAKVTKLLFAVSFTFLLLSLPSYVVRLRLAMLVMVERLSSTPNLDQMLQVVFQILYYLSFAVNLLVYLSCGDSFRHVFLNTYLPCFVAKPISSRRRSEVSRTSYTVVRMEATGNAVEEQEEEETTLIT